MIYGYARCSTDEIKQDITRQTRELKEYGATDETIYLEYESGTKSNREQFNRLLNKVNEGDTIVTTEVSRLTRSTKQLCDVIDLVQGKKLKLIVGKSMTIDCTTGELDAMTKAFLQISGVFSELERNMISARVKSGMANAKANGKIVGRPTTSKEDIPNNVIKSIELLKVNKINKTECARLAGISRPTLNKYLEILEQSN